MGAHDLFPIPFYLCMQETGSKRTWWWGKAFAKWFHDQPSCVCVRPPTLILRYSWWSCSASGAATASGTRNNCKPSPSASKGGCNDPVHLQVSYLMKVCARRLDWACTLGKVVCTPWCVSEDYNSLSSFICQCEKANCPINTSAGLTICLPCVSYLHSLCLPGEGGSWILIIMHFPKA